MTQLFSPFIIICLCVVVILYMTYKIPTKSPEAQVEKSSSKQVQVKERKQEAIKSVENPMSLFDLRRNKGKGQLENVHVNTLVNQLKNNNKGFQIGSTFNSQLMQVAEKNKSSSLRLHKEIINAKIGNYAQNAKFYVSGLNSGDWV